MRVPGTLFLRNLVHSRTLLFQLVQRDFRQRFIGSAAGWLWGLIQPLVMLVLWNFVFRVCLKTPPPEPDLTPNYTLFLATGYLPWMLFQESVMRSSNSLVENSNLITKTVFPSEIVPVSIFLSSLINHLLALVLVLGLIVHGGAGLTPQTLILPLYMLLLGMLAVGVGWIFSSLQVYLRDTAQIAAVIMTCWFWVTPIFIGEQNIPVNLRFLIHWNPLAWVVRAYRERLLSARPVALDDLFWLTAWSVVVFVCGGLFFRHLKRGFADVL